MGLYERSPMRPRTSTSASAPLDSINHDIRDLEGSDGPRFASARSYSRSAFPPDVIRAQISPRTTHDAADNLLSLVQSGHQQDGGRGSKRRTEQDHTRMKYSKKYTQPVMLEAEESPRPKRRDKKPTYIVRKEKKALLKMEVEELQQQVLYLRRASGIPDSFFAAKENLLSKVHDNKRLRVEARKQDMLLRNAYSIMAAEYLMKCPESPIDNFIHMTSDLKQRRAALLTLKEIKLQQADDFITERSKLLPRTTPWCQEAKFETEDGHFCAEKLDNTPFHGVRSVRQVFEALQFFFRNMEISISEMLGDITVREGDESSATSRNAFSNHRLVTSMCHGVKVEKNIVKFFKLVEPNGDEGEGHAPYGLVATDSVDVDDMYPYVPGERIRMDINAAMKFTEHYCQKPPNQKKKTRTRHPLYGHSGFPYPRDPDEDDEDDGLERVVVLTRFFRVKLHHSEMDIPPHVLQEVRQSLACFSDTMVQSMHRVIYESR